VERDKSISSELSAAGWTVLRIWESDIKKDVKACADQVEYAYWNIRRNQKTRGVKFDEST
jgi:very-short-patch-repair endonuclease